MPNKPTKTSADKRRRKTAAAHRRMQSQPDLRQGTHEMPRAKHAISPSLSREEPESNISYLPARKVMAKLRSWWETKTPEQKQLEVLSWMPTPGGKAAMAGASTLPVFLARLKPVELAQMFKGAGIFKRFMRTEKDIPREAIAFTEKTIDKMMAELVRQPPWWYNRLHHAEWNPTLGPEVPGQVTGALGMKPRLELNPLRLSWRDYIENTPPGEVVRHEGHHVVQMNPPAAMLPASKRAYAYKKLLEDNLSSDAAYVMSPTEIQATLRQDKRMPGGGKAARKYVDDLKKDLDKRTAQSMTIFADELAKAPGMTPEQEMLVLMEILKISGKK